MIMKVRNEDFKWRTGRVIKKFYHSEKFGYHGLIKEDEPTDSKSDNIRKRKQQDYSFIVPWQMD